MSLGMAGQSDGHSALWQHLVTIEDFLERVSQMPDIEAEHGLLARKGHQAAEVAQLQLRLRNLDNARGVKGREAREIGYRLQAITTENARLTVAIKQVRDRMERTRWANAVRAVFGDEGWALCREWMAAEQAAQASASAQHATSALATDPVPGDDAIEDEAVARPRG